MARIIVGVDGSGHSRRALQWAMREAGLRHVALAVVTVLPAPVLPATRIYWAARAEPDTGAGLELVEKAIREFVDTAGAGLGGPVPAVTVAVTTGSPVEELVKASRDADLLVVGARGSGGFAGLLAGSVSVQVVHHAVCPVVVVPEPR